MKNLHTACALSLRSARPCPRLRPESGLARATGDGCHTGMFFASHAWIASFQSTARGTHMESVKARITGDGIDTSVEFSVEEVIAHQRAKPWAELDEAGRQAAMKDYALMLVRRQSGIAGDLRVSLEGGTFSAVREQDI
jgi:hypothetical protein